VSELAQVAAWLSLQVALITVLIVTPAAVLLAHWMARARWRGKVLLDTLILLPLGLPPAVIGFWLLSGLGEHGAVGQWLRDELGLSLTLYPGGAVIAASLMTLPLMTRLLRPAFEAHEPMAVAVARTLGASRWQAWRTLTLPMVAPAVASAMALGLAAAWGESGATLVLSAWLRSPDASHAGGTAVVTLWAALREPAQAGVARELAGVSLLLALVSVMLSETLRARWLRHLSVRPRHAPSQGPLP